MNRKINLLVLLLLAILFVPNLHGAEPETTTLNELDPLPPSPNAASLGVFGDVDVGLYTGAVQYGIPIYTFKTRHLEIPISLNYSSSGLKVDQIASWVGLGWSLNAGGVITRTVRDWPDEYATESIPDLTQIGQQSVIDYILDSDLASHDSESDLYTFNFGSYSGKFVYDHNSEEFIPIKHTPISISKTVMAGDDYGFQIITPDGTYYYFEELEKSKYLASSKSVGNGSDILTITSWYLSEIEHHSGEIINLYYDNATTYTYSVGAAQTITRKLNSNNICDGNLCCDSPTGSDDPYYNQVTVGTKNLSSIECDGIGRVDFIATKGVGARKDINDYQLDGIEVYNEIDIDPIKEFEFNFSNVKSSGFTNDFHTGTPVDSSLFYRLFLDSFGEIDNALYHFNYHSRDALPPRLSFAQDHWGYFNGQTNASFIPEPPDLYLISGINYADKEPDSDYSMKGLLDTITYPTGGATALTYEAPLYDKLVLNSPPSNMHTLVAETSSSDWMVSYSSYDTVEMGQNVEFIFTVTYCKNNNCSYLDPDSVYYGSVSVSDENQTLFTDVLEIEPRDLIHGPDTTFQKEITFTCYFRKGVDYTVTVTTRGHPMESYLTYYTKSNSSSATYIESEIGGVRIKKIDPSENSKTRYFYYNKYRHRNSEFSLSVEKPQYFNLFEEIKMQTTSTGGSGSYCGLVYCPRVSLTSSSVRNLYDFSGSHIYYPFVTESVGGENFENGGIEYAFDVELDEECDEVFTTSGNEEFNSLYVPRSNESWNNGTKLRESYFKVDNGDADSTKVIEYEYAYQDLDLSDTTLQHKDIIAYSIRKNFEPGCYDGDDFGISNMEIYSYNIYARWKPLTKIISTIYDTDGANGVSTTTEYTYYNPNHAQPYKFIESDSEGLTNTTINKYADDYVSGIQDQLFLDTLVTNNRKGVLIESQSWTDAELVGGILNRYCGTDQQDVDIYTLYAEQPYTVSMPSPPYDDFTEVNVGTTASTFYEKNVKVESNLNHQPVEITQWQGVPTSYVWDKESHYPIAKAKGAYSNELFYTSFEDNGESGTSSSSARTGEKVKAISTEYSIPFTFQNGDYLITYYWRAGESYTWTLRKESVNGTSFQTDEDSGQIDELRVHPADALMTTYTYDPLIGKTSETDPNGRTTYYEYDSLGRLVKVCDHDENILQEYEYNYAQ